MFAFTFRTILSFYVQSNTLLILLQASLSTYALAGAPTRKVSIAMKSSVFLAGGRGMVAA